LTRYRQARAGHALDDVASNICQLDDVSAWVKARVDDVAGNIWQSDDAASNICQNELEKQLPREGHLARKYTELPLRTV